VQGCKGNAWTRKASQCFAGPQKQLRKARFSQRSYSNAEGGLAGERMVVAAGRRGDHAPWALSTFALMFAVSLVASQRLALRRPGPGQCAGDFPLRCFWQ